MTSFIVLAFRVGIYDSRFHPYTKHTSKDCIWTRIKMENAGDCYTHRAWNRREKLGELHPLVHTIFLGAITGSSSCYCYLSSICLRPDLVYFLEMSRRGWEGRHLLIPAAELVFHASGNSIVHTGSSLVSSCIEKESRFNDLSSQTKAGLMCLNSCESTCMDSEISELPVVQPRAHPPCDVGKQHSAAFTNSWAGASRTMEFSAFAVIIWSNFLYAMQQQLHLLEIWIISILGNGYLQICETFCHS